MLFQARATEMLLVDLAMNHRGFNLATITASTDRPRRCGGIFTALFGAGGFGSGGIEIKPAGHGQSAQSKEGSSYAKQIAVAAWSESSRQSAESDKGQEPSGGQHPFTCL